MNAVLKIKVPKATFGDALVAFIFVSYFCSEALRSTVVRFTGSDVFAMSFR